MSLLCAIVLAQQVVRYDLSPSRTFVFDVRRSFRALDESEESTTIEIWSFKPVEQLAGGSALVEFEKATTGLVVDGREIAVRAIPHRGTEKRSTRGDVRDRQPTSEIEPALELRLLRIGDIEFPSQPVTVGQSWQRETKPTDDGLPAASWVWTPTESKSGSLTGSFTFVEKGIEKPIQAEGKFTVSLADGWPIDLSFKAVNVHQIGDEEKLPCVYSFSIKRR